ncbi:MAG: hypothetical protein ACRDYZ_15395 [Acidimicrobiales bacterium]
MVKFGQVVASASGAIASAVIASFFGVKGTIIGVAIGSVVATTGSALVGHWIERTHRAVRQVAGEQNPLVRRLGSTGTAGTVTASEVERTPATARRAAPGSASSARRAAGPGRRPARWVLTGAAAFAVGLLVVTLVELGAGRPLAALIGPSTAVGGTTAGHMLGATAPAAPTTTTPTTTTAGSGTTSTTGTPPSTSTTTSAPTTTTSAPTTTTSAPPTTAPTTATTAGGSSGSSTGG